MHPHVIYVQEGGVFLEKAYEFRLYPTAKQEELIRKTIGCSRFVYTQALAA